MPGVAVFPHSSAQPAQPSGNDTLCCTHRSLCTGACESCIPWVCVQRCDSYIPHHKAAEALIIEHLNQPSCVWRCRQLTLYPCNLCGSRAYAPAKPGSKEAHGAACGEHVLRMCSRKRRCRSNASTVQAPS